MDKNQFYPTPKDLADRAVNLFTEKEFSCLLDPSAGRGDLLDAAKRAMGYCNRRPVTHAAEIDINHHPTLREKNHQVVGTDFLAMTDLSRFSHILMNPPFNQGAAHVLHAWNGLWDGEIVAIINAETIKNPYTKERQLLLKIIEDNGEYEFVENAFIDAERSTPVEVALIHLTKKGGESIYQRIISDTVDNGQAFNDESLFRDVRDEENQLTVPGSTIKNAVRAYNAAAQAIKESAIAAARAGYYMSLSGCEYLTTEEGIITEGAVGVRKQIDHLHSKLLSSSWRKIIKAGEFLDRLNSGAIDRFNREIETISKLAFTTENIYALLDGIVASQGRMQIEMMLDVFDDIVKYHPENRVYYKGWKSNAKHRSNGIKIKSTRFILPMSSRYGSSRSVDCYAERKLADFDKVFAMLDGKMEPEVSLVSLSRGLRLSSDRASSSYFDVRYYGGAGTMHFYPNKQCKKLIDRLNRFVGRERNWLPDESTAQVSDAFWLQFDNAESMDKEVQEKIKTKIKRYADENEKSEAISAAIDETLADNGIDPNFEITIATDNPAPALPFMDDLFAA